MPNKNRCKWCIKDQLYKDYHDNVWGIPVHDDQKLFEYLNLEGAQAGLSWYTVLKRKESYYRAFDAWNAHKIIKYDQAKREELLQNAGIIRNKLKVNAVIVNAACFLKVQEEFGSFDKYIWSFVNGKTIVNKLKDASEGIATSKESDALSKDLKKRGFKFVGSTICYAFMQAVGMVDDHYEYCWKKGNA